MCSQMWTINYIYAYILMNESLFTLYENVYTIKCAFAERRLII